MTCPSVDVFVNHNITWWCKASNKEIFVGTKIYFSFFLQTKTFNGFLCIRYAKKRRGVFSQFPPPPKYYSGILYPHTIRALLPPPPQKNIWSKRGVGWGQDFGGVETRTLCFPDKLRIKIQEALRKSFQAIFYRDFVVISGVQGDGGWRGHYAASQGDIIPIP